MPSGDTSLPAGSSPGSDETFQRLLLRLSQTVAQSVESHSLALQFCQMTREFFGVDGVYLLRLTSGKLVGTDGAGPYADRFRGEEFQADDTYLAKEAIQTRRTIYTNRIDPTLSPLASAFEAKAAMATPLIVSREVIGAVVFINASDADFFNDDLAAKATILADYLANILKANRLAESLRDGPRLPESTSYPTSHQSESLLELVLDVGAHLRLPEFAERLVRRSAATMGAGAGALLLKGESGLETEFLLNATGAGRAETALPHRMVRAVTDALSRRAHAVVSGKAAELLTQDLATTLRWSDCVLVRLLNPAGDLMGMLCLANLGKPLSSEDEQFLQRIAGYTAVALANARLFSRLDSTNRHWMEIFDAISDFIVVHDSVDNILRVNRSLADFIGVPPSELIGVNMCALLAMDNAALARACPFCRDVGDDTDEYVHPVLGSTYLVSTSRVPGSGSEGPQTIHVLKDITDRREAERRYRELFGNIQEGLFFAHPGGGFVEVNDALVRMLGYSTREELLQVEVGTQVFGSAERYHAFAAPMQAHGVVRNHEEALRRKDGTTVHVLINAFAVRDAQGRITQYRGLMLDISDLKAFQAELQRERDFSGKILNNTQSLILVTDTAGLVSYANRRWQFMGYEQQQVLGSRLEQLVAPVRRQALNDAFAAIVSGQQVDNLDLQVLRGDGRVGHFSVNLSPMRDELGNVTSIVVVMSDITDAAALQGKLMHAEKMAAVGQLVSGVAHEVNNPLTAILGFADLLMENEEIPEAARKDLRVILQEAQRTKQIVQNLLSFARQMPPQRKPVDINSILRRTLQLRTYDFQSHGVEVLEELDQNLPYVIGDSHQLQQVFLNIVNNAYDAVRETGRPARIQIKTRDQDGQVEVSFRDNGHGISQPDRIFDPFFTTKEVGKGTGLGLSICYGIVHEHGGEILCHNNAGADGATFIVRFPAASEPASIGAAAGVIQR